jgi:hypothetical protein
MAAGPPMSNDKTKKKRKRQAAIRRSQRKKVDKLREYRPEAYSKKCVKCGVVRSVTQFVGRSNVCTVCKPVETKKKQKKTPNQKKKQGKRKKFATRTERFDKSITKARKKLARAKKLGPGMTLAALKECAGIFLFKPPEWAKSQYSRQKHYYCPLRKHHKCFVCGEQAEIRHHIIQLHHGGFNERRNLVRLCRKCHKEIHPWMKSW